MQATIKLWVQNKTIRMVKHDNLTTGSMGNKIVFEFDGHTWDDLDKQVLFKVDNTRVIQPLTGLEIVIPEEVCSAYYLGKVLYIGLRGTKDLNRIQYTEDGETKYGYHHVNAGITKYYRTYSGGVYSDEITEQAIIDTIIILDVDYPTPYFRLGVLEAGSSPNGATSPTSPIRVPYEEALKQSHDWAVGPNGTYTEGATDTNNAKYYAEFAAEAVTHIDDQVDIAKSWAVGPSGEGEWGTDTNNAKYYSELRATASEEAAAARDAAIAARDKYPQIIDGTWHYWDPSTSQYIDTEVSPTGPQGLPGPTGADGEDGEQGPRGYAVGSIARTSGTGAPGETDTYTMYLNDSETSPTVIGTFDVYNGEDGSDGDMQQINYDTVQVEGQATHPVYAAGGIPQYVAGIADTKITNPTGGTAGQLLQKTNEGVAWADPPPTGVTGIKGSEEVLYRTGNVIIDCEDIGAQTEISAVGVLERLTDGNIVQATSIPISFASDILPVVTPSDNGKILKVVNGKWTAVSPE